MMPLLLVAFSAGCDGGTGGSYLYQPAYCLDECLRGPTTPYVPQPGDIMLATDNKVFWKLTHNLAGTGHPHHVRRHGPQHALESTRRALQALRTVQTIQRGRF